MTEMTVVNGVKKKIILCKFPSQHFSTDEDALEKT